MSIAKMKELAISANHKQAGLTLPPSWILALLDSHADLISTLKQIASISGEIDVVDQAEDAVEKAEAL
jgi:hypothetical protein